MAFVIVYISWKSSLLQICGFWFAVKGSPRKFVSKAWFMCRNSDGESVDHLHADKIVDHVLLIEMNFYKNMQIGINCE